MTINNANIYNAAIAGATAGVASRWLTNTNAASYDAQTALIEEFATAFDAAIAPISGGGSKGQADVVNEICAAFWTNRIIPPDVNIPSAVLPLVALYTSAAARLQPDGGGTTSITPLSKMFVVDPGGTGTDGAFSGNKVYTTLAAAIAAVPDHSTLLLMAYDYTGEGDQTWDSKSLAFVAFGPEREDTKLPHLTVTTVGDVSIDGMQVSNVTSPGTIKTHQVTLVGTLDAGGGSGIIEVTLSESQAGAQFHGNVFIDLASYEAFGVAGGTWSGPPASFVILDAPPLPNEFYVTPAPLPYGNGSAAAPMTLAAAIAAAPVKTVSPATIFLAPGDYTSQGPVAYTDKRLSFQGTQLINESPSVPTAGVDIRPTSSDNSNLIVEIIRTNSNVIPQSQGIIVFMQDGHCEAIGDGVHFGSWEMIGASARTNVVGTANTLQNLIEGTGYNLSLSQFMDHASMTNGILNGDLIVTGNIGVSIFQGSLLGGNITCGGALQIWDCTFSSGITIVCDNCSTDLATYQRGLNANVQWPANVTIIDVNVVLTPFWVAAGTATNNNGDLVLPLGTNVAGDLFIAQLNCEGAQVPATPAGWTLQSSKTVSVTSTYIYTRDARSVGAEVGSVTFTIPAGNTPNQGMVHTFRNVATTSFVESITTASATSAGPTVSVAGPTVTAAGQGRVGCCFSSANGGVPPLATTIAGNTGGTWVKRVEGSSGLGGNYDLQTVQMGSGGTVTGGTSTRSGNQSPQVAFALVGLVAQ